MDARRFKFTELEPDYVLGNAKVAAEYLNILSKGSEPGSEITGEQLLQVIRDRPTLVRKLTEMIKSQTGKESEG